MTDFSELYRRHSQDVFRFALYLGGDWNEAEDITSETFVRAWTAPEPLRAATVKGYLLTIARNLHLQRLRRSRRHVELDEDMRDPAPGPHALAEQASSMSAMLAQLQTLPESDRAALVMRAVEGLSYDEIARALGISLAAVKARIHRGRKAMYGVKDL